MDAPPTLINADWLRLWGLWFWVTKWSEPIPIRFLSSLLANDGPTMINKLMSNSTKEFRKGNLPCSGNSFNINERNASFTPFDTTNVGPIEAANVSKFLLGHP